LHALHAAQVHREGLLAARRRAPGERPDATAAAERVVQTLLAELVVHERVGAAEELEARLGHEGEHVPGPRADGAVAGHPAVEARGHLELHRAAVTAARLRGLGHGRLRGGRTLTRASRGA